MAEIRQLIVRNVNKNVIQEFKAQAAKEGMSFGKAITMAMLLWIDKEQSAPQKSILQLKPVRFGSRKAGTDIDKDLYGG